MVQPLGKSLHQPSADKDESPAQFNDTPNSDKIQGVDLRDINAEVERWSEILSLEYKKHLFMEDK